MSNRPTAKGNTTKGDEMLTHLDLAHVVLKEFGCFVALSQDRETIFICPMNADGTTIRDKLSHMNWTEVTASTPEFVAKVNAVFGTSFDWNDFAGR